VSHSKFFHNFRNGLGQQSQKPQNIFGEQINMSEIAEEPFSAQ
jgi:hypothetical protein